MKKLVGALLALACSAPLAVAATSHFLKVTPSTVRAGNRITASGNVGSGCKVGKHGDVAAIYSNAFKYTAPPGAGSLPTVYAHLDSRGRFSVRIKIDKRIAARKYHVGGRCGGGNFGSATLRVIR